VREGQRVERRAHVGVGSQRRLELGREHDLARLVVELEHDLDAVPDGDSRGLEELAPQAEVGRPAVDRQARADRRAVDRAANRRARLSEGLARVERHDDPMPASAPGLLDPAGERPRRHR
jgi:hypothetical protein